MARLDWLQGSLTLRSCLLLVNNAILGELKSLSALPVQTRVDLSMLLQTYTVLRLLTPFVGRQFLGAQNLLHIFDFGPSIA